MHAGAFGEIPCSLGQTGRPSRELHDGGMLRAGCAPGQAYMRPVWYRARFMPGDLHRGDLDVPKFVQVGGAGTITETSSGVPRSSESAASEDPIVGLCLGS